VPSILWLICFVHEISQKPLNGFVTKFTRKTCLVPYSEEFQGQGQRSRSPGTKTAFLALSATCTRFMFGKTSLASSCVFLTSGNLPALVFLCIFWLLKHFASKMTYYGLRRMLHTDHLLSLSHSFYD